MKELKQSIDKLVTEELERANKKYSLFNSTHEGYAVIKEEIEEAEYEMTQLKINLDYLWHDVKQNEKGLDDLEEISTAAINLAAEAIQIAAMAQKYKDSLKVK